ncbi:MAG: hypothetical protein KC516_02090 [Nanoarchaeota archaeon]|nr:hypothetical protein [Nanoarchaeota archaeon]
MKTKNKKSFPKNEFIEEVIFEFNETNKIIFKIWVSTGAILSKDFTSEFKDQFGKKSMRSVGLVVILAKGNPPLESGATYQCSGVVEHLKDEKFAVFHISEYEIIEKNYLMPPRPVAA